MHSPTAEMNVINNLVLCHIPSWPSGNRCKWKKVTCDRCEVGSIPILGILPGFIGFRPQTGKPLLVKYIVHTRAWQWSRNEVKYEFTTLTRHSRARVPIADCTRYLVGVVMISIGSGYTVLGKKHINPCYVPCSELEPSRSSTSKAF